MPPRVRCTSARGLRPPAAEAMTGREARALVVSALRSLHAPLEQGRDLLIRPDSYVALKIAEALAAALALRLREPPPAPAEADPVLDARKEAPPCEPPS